MIFTVPPKVNDLKPVFEGRDPRKMESVAQRWHELEGMLEGWKYDKAEMEEDFFSTVSGKTLLWE